MMVSLMVMLLNVLGFLIKLAQLINLQKEINKDPIILLLGWIPYAHRIDWFP